MTHSKRYTQLYKVWAGIKDRTNLNNKNCKNNYRKLKIKMCKEWQNDFVSFYEWAMANGYKEEKLPNGKNKYTIDRIDTYGDYCPENCRWVTNKQQMNNMTTNRYIIYKGEKKTLSEWAEIYKIQFTTALFRLNSGWDLDDVFNKSTDKQNYYIYQGKKLNINDICKITGLTKTNVWNRIHRGWDINRIINQKARVVRKNV